MATWNIGQIVLLVAVILGVPVAALTWYAYAIADTPLILPILVTALVAMVAFVLYGARHPKTNQSR